MRLLALLALLSCTREVKKDMELQELHTEDEGLNLNRVEGSNTQQKRWMDSVITNPTLDIEATVNIDPVPATATAPAIPAKHVVIHAHQEGGKTVIGEKSQEKQRDWHDTDLTAHKQAQTNIKMRDRVSTKSYFGPDWEFYLFLLIVILVGGGLGGLAIKLKRIWSPL